MSQPARHAPLLAALLAVVALAACAEETSTSAASPSRSPSPSVSATASRSASSEPETGYFGTILAQTLPAGAFVLTDQTEEVFRFPRDLRGRVTLLYFGYTHCPDICPGTLAGIAVALRDLPAEVRNQVDVVFVTVDPARDTVEVLRDWVGLFSEDFVGLTGTEAEIADTLAIFGFSPPEIFDLGEGEYSVGHPAGVLAFTPDGLAHLEYPFGVTVEMWEHDLTKLVEEGWRKV